MNRSRVSAFVAYLIPVLGWLWVLLAERKNGFAVYHLKQAVNLAVSVVGVSVAWVVAGWALAWIPYGFVISIALFALIIPAFVLAFVFWIMGMINALRGRFAPLPLVGGLVSRSAVRARLPRRPTKARAAA